MSTYQTDQQKAYRTYHPKRRALISVAQMGRRHLLFNRLLKSPAYLRENINRLVIAVVTRFHRVMDRRDAKARSAADLPQNYIEVDEGQWVLRYLDEVGTPQTHVLELEWNIRHPDDIRKVAAEWLDVSVGDIEIKE